MVEASDIPSRRRIDAVTAIMAMVTIASLAGAFWMKWMRGPDIAPATVGSIAPPLRLLDVRSSEPLVLAGVRGKVIWVVFWSTKEPKSAASFAELEPVWTSFKAESRFTMLAAAVESDSPAEVRRLVSDTRTTVPVYLASTETCRRFGAITGLPPLNVLIDADGRIATLARGTSPQTIERIRDQAQKLVDQLEPTMDTRFAQGKPSSGTRL
jgi:hypothetical protein